MRCISKIKEPRKKILFLGYRETKIIPALIKANCNVDYTNEKIPGVEGYDLLISFGYKHILKKNDINIFNCPILNLHISYLPFNRGAHPNFWSFYDNTLSGVTIHLVDEGVDTGPIIFQRLVSFTNEQNTFKKTYEKLNFEIEDLFLENLEELLNDNWTATRQIGLGTKHDIKDLPSNFSGWNSNIKREINKLYKEGLNYDH